MGNRDLVSAVSRDRVERAAPSTLAVACVMGWLLPGAGHWYLGKRARAIVFFVLVTLSFVMGAFFHGRFSVLDRRPTAFRIVGVPVLSTFQVVACLGAGPMEMFARSMVYGAPVYLMPEEDEVASMEGRRPRTVVGRALRSRNEEFDSPYGTAYLWTAGLMNLLLLLDVFDIGIGRKV